MTRTVRVLALLALALLFAAPSDAARRIVQFRPEVPQAERIRIAESAGGRVVRELPLIDAVVVELPASAGPVRVADAQLRGMPEVDGVDEDRMVNWLNAADAPGVDFRIPALGSIIRPFSARPSAPAVEAERRAAALRDEQPWGIERVRAPRAWRATRGRGVKVAVIDTGIDRQHPDLVGRLRGGWNYVGGNDDYDDDNGHGTHCAGTIAASRDGKGVVGVAPEAQLYGVKVLSAGGYGTFSDVIAGMQWAVQNRMDVASMSLGAHDGMPALEKAVKAMRRAGVTLIAAAGNNWGGSVSYPGAYRDAIAIAASNSEDQLAAFSSKGSEVDLIAPGQDVRSTYLDGGYRSLSGTSMATPHVAGLAALYIARNPRAHPDEVRYALEDAARRLRGVPSEGQGAGLPTATSLPY